jgi:hypothetical protein
MTSLIIKYWVNIYHSNYKYQNLLKYFYIQFECDICNRLFNNQQKLNDQTGKVYHLKRPYIKTYSGVLMM